MSTAPAWVTLDVGELNELLARASRVLDEPDHEKLRLTVEGFIELVRLLACCTMGKNVYTEIKCHSLLPLDDIVNMVCHRDTIPEVGARV